MITKITVQRYFWLLVAVMLVACQQQVVQEVGTNTPNAISTTEALETSTPDVSSPTPLPVSTLLPATDIPTSLPTQPIIPIITPDAIQMERWKEYQAELAKVVLSSNPEIGHDLAVSKDALCEWDILGQSGPKIYVYVVCVIAAGNGDMRKPAIIYLEPDGSIQKVQLPEPKAGNSEIFDYDPFPVDVQGKFCYYFDPFPSDLPRCPNSSMYSSPRLDILYTHLKYRIIHPEEPPLIVLLATP